MLSIQYLSNNDWHVWIKASCLVTSLHANGSLLHCTDSSFLFDMQMFWLEEFRSFSVALKPLHYRGRICGMSCSCGFSDTAKKCHQGSTNGLSATQSAFLLNGEIRRGIMGSLWLLRTEILRLTLSCTSSFHYWLPGRCWNEVFLCRVYHHSWSLFFSSELNLIALQKNIKHASYSTSWCFKKKNNFKDNVRDVWIFTYPVYIFLFWNNTRKTCMDILAHSGIDNFTLCCSV